MNPSRSTIKRASTSPLLPLLPCRGFPRSSDASKAIFTKAGGGFLKSSRSTTRVPNRGFPLCPCPSPVALRRPHTPSEGSGARPRRAAASLSSVAAMMDLDPRHYENVTVNDNDVRNIVLSYLVHNCFNETAETFLACAGMKQPVDYLVDMEKRKSIFHFALEGNALKAIELTEQLAPNLLEDNKDLYFDLLSLHFIDLVCSKKCTEALEFAQTKLTPLGKVHKYVEKLEDLMALLAYEEPEKSPMFHLLSSDYRQNVADCLNRAILAHANLPSYSSVERLIQQATVVRQCLHQELGKDGPPPFSLKAFLKN